MNYVHSLSEERRQNLLRDLNRIAAEAKDVPYGKQFRLNDCTVTVYDSGKAVFQGANSQYYAENLIAVSDVILPQCGSDEVGTGDLFGPICVCACYIDKKIYEKVRDLHLIDSKQLTDEIIMQMGPKLVKTVPHSLLILNNEKFNEVNKTNNLNEIKARMHNKCYLNLQDRGIRLPKVTVIDQFCPDYSYYRYLRNEERIVRGITFTTKAENQYIAVACGAIISRYGFLLTLKEMEEKYDFSFPKGAGGKTDEALKGFIERYGLQELGKVCKLSWKNVRNLLSEAAKG